jgi:2-amino-4-hydroxy-6-hydroxymethyldihydropteridine diphosphokinase
LGETAGVQVERVSRFIETAPVGGPARQEDYLNGVARLRTSLDAHELLDVLQAIERRFGRERAERWGPRTLDLDVLLYDDAVIETERLIVPHARMHERRFVLEPLCEIAPEVVHPVLGLMMRELLMKLP